MTPRGAAPWHSPEITREAMGIPSSSERKRLA